MPKSPPAPADSANNPKPVSSKPPGSHIVSSPRGVGGQIIDSTAMTKVGDFDWNELLASDDPAARTDSSDDSGPKFRSLNEPDFIPIPSTFTPISPLPASDLEKPIHGQAWQSNAAARRRQMLVLATVGITGSLVAVGCFVLFVQMVGNNPQPIASGNGDNAVGVKSIEAQPPLPELDKSEPIAPPSQQTVVVPSENPKDPNVGSGQGVDESTEKEPIESPDTKANRPPADSTTQKNPKSIDSQPAVATPNPDQPKTPEQAKEDASTAIPPVFSKFRISLQPDNINAAIIEPSPERAELNIENAPVVQKQVFHPAPKPIPVWAEKSNLAFSSFRQKDISLLRCIDLFGRMTGVGITVDWQSCRIAGIDLAKKMDIDEKDKTIAELVSQIVLANGLEWSFDAKGLPVVSAPKATMEAKSQIDWSTAGLFQDGAEREGCETLIRLWEYQDVCSFSDGRLQWNDQATPIQKANMKASLCELATLQRLEASPWSKPQELPLMYSLDQWNKSVVTLERKTKLTLEAHERRPIPDLLMTVAAETKLNLVIDWQNTWQHGLTPTNTAAIVLGGRTFPQTAKRFLTDYALEIVPILDDTVLLTTREFRQSLVRIVPLRMPKNSKLDDLRQYLRTLAPLEGNRYKFKIVPIPGTDELFFARICSPSSEQLNDPDIVLGLGWPERP
ncbi:MAG: hypothetical protein NTY15_17830 [Planctomycetota bacterium]|nr:hypothetical protein [Planctomycetota bacterium]